MPELTFSEYQRLAAETAVFNPKDGVYYTSLGLCGEAGEIANKVKKVIRDDDGVLTDEKREVLKSELGDVLWYASQLAEVMGISLSEAASENIQKLHSRLARGTIHGEGDNR